MSNDDLLLELAQFSGDPLGFVLFNYPWGEPGTELSKFADGPDEWQRIILTELGDGIISIEDAIAQAHAKGEEAETDPLRFARTSGHGIGKSALVAWIIDWAMSTMEDTKGVVTANTENQLKTKTWAEVAKWHRLGLSSVLFKFTATALFSRDPEHERTWRIDMVPWSERNTEAFAGLHNKGKRILVVFDEGSAIPDVIYEVTEGALTDSETQIIWAVFGNPTRNSGRFRECFSGGKFEHRWSWAEIDSRTARMTNKKLHQEWIDDYGLDSDFVRVRVLGKFPRNDLVSFISLEAVKEAQARPLPEENLHPVVLGVDVARFGDDNSVIVPRQGPDLRSREIEVYNGLSTVELAKRVFTAYTRYNATTVYVDEGGVGGGVVDLLFSWSVPVIPVSFGAKADGINKYNGLIHYSNKRAEIWGGLRDDLAYLCLPQAVPKATQTIEEDLTGPSFMYVRDDKYIQLESKRDMRRRKVPSPDIGDGIAVTYALPPFVVHSGGGVPAGEQYGDDYNPYEENAA